MDEYINAIEYGARIYDILLLLKKKFGQIDPDLDLKSKEITDIEKLDELFDKAFYSKSLDEFKKFFNSI
ncbi:MAG: hypothetical protein LBE80_03815, partial [Deltaproteobacteria bacterium]|jgi:hypothetical protein|nr:hypothetical protein [Deltaproteobacteria bacterium]